MAKIIYPHLHDGATVKAVHALHQEALFFELLFPVIEKQTKQELCAEDSINSWLTKTADNWVKQELAILGFVSTYHMWERQLKELLLEQQEQQNIDIPNQQKAENMVRYGKRALSCVFGISIPKAFWIELDKARIVVNAFKHGPGKQFDAAMKKHPDFFFKPEDKRHPPVVTISLVQLRRLIKIVADFWEDIPREIDFYTARPSFEQK